MSNQVVHVWVKLDFNPHAFPGLVLEWRRAERGWDALVVYRDGERAVTTWLQAHHLKPVREYDAPKNTEGPPTQ